MWARLKARYGGLSPEKKRRVTIAVAAAGILAVALWTYDRSEDKELVKGKGPEGSQETTYRLETKILDKKYHEDRAAELKKATQMYGDIMRQMEELKGLVEEEKRGSEELRAKIGSSPEEPKEPVPGRGRTFPKPFQPYEDGHDPAKATTAHAPVPEASSGEPLPRRPPEVVGGIQMVSLETSPATQADKKKDPAAESVYLPPSFVAAHLLSGVDAPVLKEGTANPVPMLLRLKDLAVLPNRVKRISRAAS